MTGALLALLLAGAFAAGTVLVGWWGVIAVGVASGALLAGRPRAAGLAALGAVLGWAGLLAWAAVGGPLLGFAGRLAAAMGVPGFVPLPLTLLLALLLGWSAAAVGQEARLAWRGRGA